MPSHPLSRAMPLAVLMVMIWPASGGASAVRIVERAPVTGAVLYPTGAEVERRVEVELEGGRQRLVIRGLPEKLDSRRLQFRMEPDNLVDIRSIATRLRPAPGPASPRERRLEREIEALRDEIRQRDDRIRAAKIQLKLLDHIGEAAAERASRELLVGQPDPEAWRKSWEVVGSGAIEILHLIRVSENEKRELSRQLEAKQRELDQLRTGQRGSSEAVIELVAEHGGRFQLQLRHFVEDAGWKPLYEMRLRTRKGEIRLLRRAIVRQRTGEDWKGISLQLATSRPQETIRPPRLEPWYVDILEIRPLAEGVGAPPKTRQLLRPPVPAPPVRVETRDFQTLYVLTEAVDMPADGSEQVVDLARDRMPAEVTVEAAPKLDPFPYLVARFAYTGEDPLLPGPVRLVQDGTYVGMSDLGLTAPGANLRIPFGRDDDIEVEQRVATDLRSETGLIKSYRRIERAWRTRIRNRHKRSIDIVLYDRLPVPRDERIKVAMLEGSTPPTARDVDGRKGVLAWRSTFGPGEEKEILFGFVVTVPEGLEVGGL